MNFNNSNPDLKKFSYLRLLLDEEENDEDQPLHMNSSNNVPNISSSSSNGTGITNPSMRFSQHGPSTPMNYQTILLGQVGLRQRVSTADNVRKASVFPNRVEVTEYFSPQINYQHQQVPRVEVTEVIRRTTTHFLPPNPSSNIIIRNPSLSLTNNTTTFRSRGLSFPSNTYPASFYNANVPIRGSYQEKGPSSFTPTHPKPNRGSMISSNEPEPRRDGGYVNHDKGQPLDVSPIRMVFGYDNNNNNNNTTTTTLTNQNPCINNYDHDEKNHSQNYKGKHRIALPNNLAPWLNNDCVDDHGGDDDISLKASTSNQYFKSSSSSGRSAGKGKVEDSGRTRSSSSVGGNGSKLGKAYMCPRCCEEFHTSQSYASHVMSHYRFEPIEKAKKRHAIIHQSKNLRIVNTSQGITIAPDNMLPDDHGNLINGSGSSSSGPKRRGRRSRWWSDIGKHA